MIKKHKKRFIRQDAKFPNIYYIEFLVKPNSRKDLITKDYGGQLRIEVSTLPQKGKANKALIKLISRKLKISSSAIQLIQGATSTTKIFKIEKNNSCIDNLWNELLL